MKLDTTVHVALAGRSYDIVIGEGVLAQAGEALRRAIPSARRCFIVSNPTVFALYGDVLNTSFTSTGLQCSHYLIPDGEQHKSWETLDGILSQLLTEKYDRKCVVIALGGGVVGDITGLAAALFQRGVAFMQIPTTLLAQVDSSVGGKVAVNHPLGKNMIGAFHQPKCVLIDTHTLATVPDRELSAGLAEVVKYGLIGDALFFEWVERNAAALRRREPAAIAYAIRYSCEAKAAVVVADETEQGVRAHLNFGHTFAHAIEAGLGYGVWLHGEAVGAGMVAAARLSALFGNLEDSDVLRVRNVIAALGCPTDLPPLGAARYWSLMQLDKKNENEAVTFITLDAIGQARVRKGVPFERVAPLFG